MASSAQRFSIPASGPDAPHCAEIIVRKSRFRAQACHCASRAAALSFVGGIRARWPDATHNCWAYVAAAPGESASVGSSDDGEPHGTAGRPMLNVLLHSGIGQICVVVTRWFGGIKLGTGGLARAYQDATMACLEHLPTRLALQMARWRVQMDYAGINQLKRGLAQCEARLQGEEYGERAQLILCAPKDRAAELEALVAKASNGRATLAELLP